MKRLISNIISCFLLIGLVSIVYSSPDKEAILGDQAERGQEQSGSSNPCQWKDRIVQAIDRINDEYIASEKMLTIEKLVFFDQNLRRLLSINSVPYPCKDGGISWSRKYIKIGVYVDKDETVTYSGALLVRAHKMNPYSKYRKYTLYSTIYGVHEFDIYGVMPNVQMALRYKKEFPSGPFIGRVYSTLGGFYKDLYMVLRDNLRDYKYNCFEPYIDGTPREKQTRRAKKLAESYYRLLLAIDSSDARSKEILNRIKDGTVRSWSFCAD
jgi:hypothetical protein